MKIAYLVPSLGLQEGQGTANLELLRRVARAGHTVDVYTSSAPPVTRALAGVRVRRVPRLPAWQLGNQLLSLATTSAMLRRGRYDIVHADAGTTFRTADVLVCHTVTDRWLGLPREVWHEPGLRGAHAAFATRFKARLEIKQAARARIALANSAMTAADLVERGVKQERIRVIPFGVDAERFRPPDARERDAARASFGIAPEAFVVCSVGAHGERKGLPLLLDVVRDEHLLIAGEHQGGRFVREAARRGLSVTMPGKLDDIRRAYWASDALVYPSRYDAFGMAVLEAMASGLPVLVSSAAGSAEIVGDAGFVRDPLDTGAWRSAIDRLRADQQTRAVMGSRGRAIARGRDWDKAGAILLEIYREFSEEPKQRSTSAE